MGDYLLKSGLCLLCIWGFYIIFLESTDMHRLKRFYLLAGMGMSLAIPLLTFTYAVYGLPPEVGVQVSAESTIYTGTADVAITRLWKAVWVVYLVGVLVFLAQFANNFLALLHKIRSNPHLLHHGCILVLSRDAEVPHSFMGYIFLNAKEYKNGNIPGEVLLHEIAHTRQRHSIDIILLELVRILLWWNPVIYLLKETVKLNHEFLADHDVLQKGVTPSAYQRTLLSYTTSGLQPTLAHAFNYSSIKKRFILMKTKSSKRSKQLRMLSLPILAALLTYGFSNKVPVYPFSEPSVSEVILQEKASATMVREYNALARKYNRSRDQYQIKEEIDRMNYIYRLMSDKQKAGAEPFPRFVKTKVASKAIDTDEDIESSGRSVDHDVQETIETEEAVETDESRETEMDEVIEIDEENEVSEVDHKIVRTADRKEVVVRNDKEVLNVVEKIVAVNTSVSANHNQDVSPPSPPSPPSQVIDLRAMADKNALFYVNDIEVSGEEAIENVKNSTHVIVDINEKNNERPVVKIISNKQPKN